MILAERAARLEAEAAAARAQAVNSNTEALIAHLKLEIEKLRRELYGSSSERKARLLEQMEMQLEDLEAAATEDAMAAEQAAAGAQTVRSFQRKRPSRKFLEGDPDSAREVLVPELRNHHAAAGALPCDAAGLCRAQSAGDDPVREVRPAPAAEPAE